MSITSVAKILGPKIWGLKSETVLKSVMTKGFVCKNLALPKTAVNALRKDVKCLDEFAGNLESLG